MTQDLPKLASLLATYLRYGTGDSHVYARVILADDSYNQDDRDYIAVGHCVQGVEAELYNVVPIIKPNRYTLYRIVDYPGSRHEPPSSDVKVVGESVDIMTILGSITRSIVGERLASAQECLAYDLEHPADGLHPEGDA